MLIAPQFNWLEDQTPLLSETDDSDQCGGRISHNKCGNNYDLMHKENFVSIATSYSHHCGNCDECIFSGSHDYYDRI